MRAGGYAEAAAGCQDGLGENAAARGTAPCRWGRGAVVGPGGGEGEDGEFPGLGALPIGNPPRRSCGLAQEDRQRSQSAGLDHHLNKPADPGTYCAWRAERAGLWGTLAPRLRSRLVAR
jgi:hypothetical protein